MKISIIFLFILSDVIWKTYETLSKTDRKKSTQEIKKKAPSAKNVYERNLVQEENIKATDIVKHHTAYCYLEKEVKKFEGITLAYVTPWNNHGYDVAKLFTNKFTYISPVWLQIHRSSNLNYEITGIQDIDLNWINEVRKNGNANIVPRLLFDGWSLSNFQALLSSEEEIISCIEVIIDVLEKNKFQGLVLEIWSQVPHQKRSEILHFIIHLSKVLKDFSKKMILVLPPPISKGNVKSKELSKKDFDNLIDHVDAVSIMTYDFSSPQNPGPNSPLVWLKACIEYLMPSVNGTKSPRNRRKILAGINFYGMQFLTGIGGKAMIGSEYIKVLSSYKPKIKWNEMSAEHFFSYKNKMNEEKVVYYPTLYSIDLRINLASEMNIGIAIWEIGQGLDYFYDLL